MITVAFSAFGADTVYEDPIVLDAQTNIVVASGDTLTLTGLISGEGSIKKTGDGTLILAHEGGNTFSGGIALNGGRLTANTSGAFGTGNVTGTGSAITFNAPDGAFANNFSLGSSSATPPTFAANTTIDGTVTIKREHSFVQNDSVSTVVFNGPVDGGKNIIYKSKQTTQFKGALSLAILYGGSSYSHTGWLELYNQNNAISSIQLLRMKVRCCATNVLNGTILSQRGADASSAGRFDLNGKDQTVKACSVESTVTSPATKGGTITSASPATLTITGTGANTSRTGYFSIDGQVSLNLNADATFSQTLAGNRQNTTTGEIKITSGTFNVGGTSSFPNAGRITVAENGTLNVNSTTTFALAGATNVVLSGTLTSALQPFTDSAVDLVVSGENASLTLPADARLTVNTLTVDGVPRSGEFIGGDESCPWLKSGEIVVLSHESADTWTGAGTTTSIAEAGNWKSGETPDMLGFCTATFADANAVCVTATVDRAVAFAGLRLDSTNGFTFAADGLGSVMSVGSGGIVAAESAEGASPIYDFVAPMRLTDTQTWESPYGTTMRLLGSTSSIVPFEKTGDGSIVISGTNTWDNRVILRSGTMTLSGTITTSSGVDTTRLDGENDNPNAGNAVYSYLGGIGASDTMANSMYLNNAVIEKAFWVDMTGSTSAYYLRASNASTNTFRGFFRSRNRVNQKLYVSAGSEVRFEGGAYFPWTFVQAGAGTVRFSKKPITYTATSDTGYSIQLRGNAIFEVGTNTIRYLTITQDGGRYDFMADHVCGLGDYGTIRMTGGLRRTNTYEPCGSVIDIHGTRQRIGAIGAYDKYYSEYGTYVGLSKIAGDAGSVFEITNNVTTRSSTFDHVPFVGGVSLVFGSPGTITFTNVTHTSTGSVEVARGTMRFRSGATWLTASKVKVGGTLVLSGGASGRDQTFGRHADWYFGENGVVSIPNGVVQHAGHVWIGDTELPPGRYSYSETADETIRSHFDPETTGVLRVHGGGEGSVVIIF